MYSAYDEHQRGINEDNTDADGEPELLEILVKDAFFCECNESVGLLPLLVHVS
ncbi:MAG: hypothetical protein ACYSUK_11405 [Planctomycetota bacterium]|jgi:hypothetical protein